MAIIDWPTIYGTNQTAQWFYYWGHAWHIIQFLPSLTSASRWTLPALGIVLIIYGIWGLIAKNAIFRET